MKKFEIQDGVSSSYVDQLQVYNIVLTQSQLQVIMTSTDL